MKTEITADDITRMFQDEDRETAEVLQRIIEEDETGECLDLFLQQLQENERESMKAMQELAEEFNSI